MEAGDLLRWIDGRWVEAANGEISLPQEGEASFSLEGEMTLHDTTRPLTWDVTAQFAPDRVTGIAKTNFTFSAFQMDRPSKLFLLSVEDNIRLEMDFVFSVGEPDGGGN